jgi:hypothetical protein
MEVAGKAEVKVIIVTAKALSSPPEHTRRLSSLGCPRLAGRGKAERHFTALWWTLALTSHFNVVDTVFASWGSLEGAVRRTTPLRLLMPYVAREELSSQTARYPSVPAVKR